MSTTFDHDNELDMRAELEQERAMEAPPYAERFWAKVDIGGEGDCWPWRAHRRELGYGRFRLGTMRTASRVAWELTYGDIPEGFYVCHHCDNPPCCNPRHLFVGTHAENVADREAKGRGRTPHCPGERNGGARLTHEQVVAIRALCRRGLPQREIAGRYGIAREHVSMIASGKRWKEPS